MQSNYDAVIMIRDGKQRAEALIRALEGQTAAPGKIYAVVSENAGNSPFSTSGSSLPAEIVRAAHPGEGSLLYTALHCTEAPFVLLLDGDSCPTEEHFAEVLLEDLEDPAAAAAYTRVYGNANPKKAGRVFDDCWFDDKRVYSRQDIYNVGPGVFLQHCWSCMYRTEDVKDVFFDPDGVTHPEFELNARLLYAGKKIVREDRVRTDYSPKFSGAKLFRECFSSAAGAKMLYTEFGWPYPDLMPDLGDNYAKTGKKGQKQLKKEGAFFGRPGYSFRVFLMRLGNAAGKRYQRLSAGLDRFLSANDYFS